MRAERTDMFNSEQETALNLISNCISRGSSTSGTGDRFADFEITRFNCTAEIIEGPNVLEMACGNGDMSLVMQKRNKSSRHRHLENGIQWAIKSAMAQGLSIQLKRSW